MVIVCLELTRANPDLNIFSIKCGTNIYFIKSVRFGPSSTPYYNFSVKETCAFLAKKRQWRNFHI